MVERLVTLNLMRYKPEIIPCLKSHKPIDNLKRFKSQGSVKDST